MATNSNTNRIHRQIKWQMLPLIPVYTKRLFLHSCQLTPSFNVVILGCAIVHIHDLLASIESTFLYFRFSDCIFSIPSQSGHNEEARFTINVEKRNAQAIFLSF